MVYIKREIENEVFKWIDSKEIIAIRGTRQCGKTTFLKKISEALIHRKTSKENIHLISFEDDFEKEKFEKNPKEYISYYVKENSVKHYFLLDEVQYIKNAGKLLKLLYDEFKNIKIIITGSSTLDLNEIGSYLVGRVLLFEMYPFLFSEFLESKDANLFNYYTKRKIKLTDKRIVLGGEPIYLDKLNKLLREYVLFGGYPAIVLEKDIEKKKFLLKNLFLTYIEKDVVKIYGSKYKQRISDLIKYLSSINSGIINYNEIACITGLYNKEVKEILHILEETYIIRLIKPFHKNLSTELKKNPRVYFIDTGLRNFMANRFDISNDEYGQLLENYILLNIKQEKVNYWRTTAKAEVDFIINEKIPIESKMNVKLTRSFRSFIESYNPDRAFLVNLNKLSKDKIKGTDVFIVPYCLI
ncbi:ATP-binding protein [Candidatus Pacearchaeota archaeon]|nr:ATP-binding protein [Candidatus Pacearchaeota archaeon]